MLRMQRAFVVPRYEVIGDSEHPKCVPNLETIKEAGVPQRYQEEGKLLFFLYLFNLRNIGNNSKIYFTNAFAFYFCSSFILGKLSQ